MPYLTVFTPTYNRAYILPKLYESLKKQTSYDFEWLVVDDGSTDGTEELFSDILKSGAPFPVVYLKKENGGKPSAINYGIKHAEGKYFMIVDSDDTLCPEAVFKMITRAASIDSDPSFIGVGAARGYTVNRYIKGVPPKVNENGWVDATNLERSLYDLDADMCEAYKTDVFSGYSFVTWSGENFVPEQIVLNSIALDGYRLRWYGDIVYICDYLEDGLTKGSRKLEKNNPMGYTMMYDHMLLYGYPLKKKLFCAVQMTAMAFYGRHLGYIFSSNSPFLAILTLPFGLILGIRRKKQFGRLL